MADLSVAWNTVTNKKVSSYSVKKPDINTDHTCVDCPTPEPPPAGPTSIPAGSVIENFSNSKSMWVVVLLVGGALIVALSYRRRR